MMKNPLFLWLWLSLVFAAGCSQVSQNTSSSDQDALIEHCKMMPEMKWCHMMNSGSSDMMNSGMAMNHGMMWHQMNHADMVKSEFDFIYLMIPHHQEAVDTATPINIATTNPQLKNLTNTIIKNQTAEIVMMKGRLTDFYSGATYEGMGYMPMMRDTSMVTDLATKEKMRTEDMIVHHQGAIDMAKKLLQIMDKNDPLIKVNEKTGKFRSALRIFAQDVITAQSKEIEEMKTMIKHL